MADTLHFFFFAAIHRDLGRLEEGANRNLMMFNKEKCKVLHRGGITPCTNTSWWTTAWKATSQKKTDVLIDNNLNMSQQCALTANTTNSLQGYIRESFGSRLREVIFPLSSELVRHLECWVQFCATYYERDVDTLEQV